MCYITYDMRVCWFVKQSKSRMHITNFPTYISRTLCLSHSFCVFLPHVTAPEREHSSSSSFVSFEVKSSRSTHRKKVIVLKNIGDIKNIKIQSE